MSSKHKRQQRQQAKAVALRPYANPEEEDDGGGGGGGLGSADEAEEDFMLPQVRVLVVNCCLFRSIGSMVSNRLMIASLSTPLLSLHTFSLGGPAVRDAGGGGRR